MASRFTCLLLIAFLQVFHIGAGCPTDLVASSTPQYVSSPNYPGMYSPNTNCGFKITADGSQRVYLETADLSLYGNKDNCQDKVEIFNGDAASGNPAKTLCGMERMMFQSSGQNVYIRFQSNGNREGKGFSLKVWSAQAFNPVCGAQTQIGNAPLFIMFPAAENPENCEYKLDAGAGNIISLDLMGWHMPGALACGKGKMEVYNGADKILDHCGPERPFWHLSSSGQMLSFRLQTTHSGPSMPFYVKIKAMSTSVTSCDMANVRIGPMSSFGYFPVFKDGSGAFCPSTVMAPGTIARLSVENPRCTGNNLPTVGFNLKEGGNAKAMSCMNGKAVYSSMAEDLVLEAKGQTSTPVLLKMASFEKNCGRSAMANELAAPSNETVKEIVLENIQRDSLCMHKIRAGTNEMVELVLESTMEDSGDCVMVMNAMTRSEEMNTMYCGRFGPVVFTSRGQELSFTVMTNEKDMRGKLHIRYYSFQRSTMCNRYENLLATRTKKTLMTPNFPSGYPLNAICSWRFVSYRSDYVVVVDVEESDLPSDCSDMGFVNDGELESNDRLGEWCGSRKPSYRGTGQTLLLTFDANHMMTAHKGFKFVYYADNAVPREVVAGTDVATIAAVFTIIIVAGGLIFIIYRLCQRRKEKIRARKADRRPITQ